MRCRDDGTHRSVSRMSSSGARSSTYLVKKEKGAQRGDTAAKVSQALCEGSAVRLGVQDPGVCRDFLFGEVMLG